MNFNVTNVNDYGCILCLHCTRKYLHKNNNRFIRFPKNVFSNKYLYECWMASILFLLMLVHCIHMDIHQATNRERLNFNDFLKLVQFYNFYFKKNILN